jgi:preprotein translocase subunit YajC
MLIEGQMYSYGAFAKLIIFVISIVIIYLIIKRLIAKRNEQRKE